MGTQATSDHGHEAPSEPVPRPLPVESLTDCLRCMEYYCNYQILNQLYCIEYLRRSFASFPSTQLNISLLHIWPSGGDGVWNQWQTSLSSVTYCAGDTVPLGSTRTRLYSCIIGIVGCLGMLTE
jgi:hypothetical protein